MDHETAIALDWQALDLDTLDVLRAGALAETERRAVLASAEQQAETIARQWATASGREDGDQWTQPTGAHDAYSTSAVVTHNGRTWESLAPANVWEPGVSGWRETTDDGSPPAWVQPTGAHDAHQSGDRVTHDGTVWESTVDGNVWEPGTHGWIQVA